MCDNRDLDLGHRLQQMHLDGSESVSQFCAHLQVEPCISCDGRTKWEEKAHRRHMLTHWKEQMPKLMSENISWYISSSVYTWFVIGFSFIGHFIALLNHATLQLGVWTCIGSPQIYEARYRSDLSDRGIRFTSHRELCANQGHKRLRTSYFHITLGMNQLILWVAWLIFSPNLWTPKINQQKTVHLLHCHKN